MSVLPTPAELERWVVEYAEANLGQRSLQPVPRTRSYSDLRTGATVDSPLPLIGSLVRKGLPNCVTRSQNIKAAALLVIPIFFPNVGVRSGATSGRLSVRTTLEHWTLQQLIMIANAFRPTLKRGLKKDMVSAIERVTLGSGAARTAGAAGVAGAAAMVELSRVGQTLNRIAAAMGSSRNPSSDRGSKSQLLYVHPPSVPGATVPTARKGPTSNGRPLDLSSPDVLMETVCELEMVDVSVSRMVPSLQHGFLGFGLLHFQWRPFRFTGHKDLRVHLTLWRGGEIPNYGKCFSPEPWNSKLHSVRLNKQLLMIQKVPLAFRSRYDKSVPRGWKFPPRCRVPPPIDITTMVREGMNTIEFTVPYREGFVVISATREKPVESLVEGVRQKEILPDHRGKACFGEGVDIEGLEVDAYELTLKCPISLCRLVTPVRSLKCKHARCVDFANVLMMAKQSGVYECPLCGEGGECGEAVDPADFRIDGFVSRVLQTVPSTCDCVLVRPDGTFEPFDPLKNKRSADIVEGHDDLEIVETHTPTVAAKKTRVDDDVIDLD